MDIDIKDVITLEDNIKYVVSSKINHENVTYYFLIDMNNYSNIKICYEDIGELVEIEDGVLIQEILPMFYKESKNVIEELKKDN